MKIKIEHYDDFEGIHHKYISIHCGISCMQNECQYYRKCKYSPSYKLHNISVNISDFMRYRLHWKKFTFPIAISSEIHSNMSGTSLCPKHIPRQYNSCYDCECLAGIDCNCDCICGNSERKQDNESYFEYRERKKNSLHGVACKYFKLSEFGNDWDRKTGDHLFSKNRVTTDSELLESKNDEYLADLLKRREDKMKTEGEIK